MDGATMHDRNDPLKKALTHGLAFWAVLGPLWVLVNSAVAGRFALDFRHAFLPAAHAVLHGHSPYSAVGSQALREGTAFLYPPLAAYLLAPFTLLPPAVAEALAVGLVAAAVPATLLALGVRDWRCHAIAFLWWPTIIAIQTANVTLPMVLGLALVWRFRDRKGLVVLLAGLVIALKLFFWPLLVWLVATRRYRTATLTGASALGFALLPWAGIGFAGMRAYPHVLASVSRSEGPRSFSFAALAHGVVSNWTAATAIETAVGAALLLLVIALGRRGRDRDAFGLAVVAILVLTPLVEMHYFALLVVVVALYRRRLGLAWFVPLLIWGASANGPGGSTIQLVHVLVIAAAAVALAFSDWPARSLSALGRPAKRLASPMRRGAGPSLSPP
jgi:hypothetical protein